MEKKSPKAKREMTLALALLPLLIVIGLLISSIIIFHMDMCVPLIAGAVICSVYGVYYLHYSWEEIEEGIHNSLKSGLSPFILIGVVGMLIGTWMLGGIVPAVIYYSLKILSPNFFLVICCIVCAIVAMVTGGSWTTAGTIGIALISVGQCMGIPSPMVAGAIISGAYFGDKMSPFSDTTNMAPAVAGTTLFEHIKHMSYTTSISIGIALVGFIFLNRGYTTDTIDDSLTQTMIQTIEETFVISPLLILPFIFIILMVVFKFPAIPGLVVNVGLGILCAILVQGEGVITVADSLMNGYVCDSGVEMVDNLLSRGGIYSMLPTLSLIMCAFVFGGVVRVIGLLETLAEAILKRTKSNGALVTATVLTCIITNMAAGEQYLSLLITGSMYKSEYEKRDLAPQNLSRALEDGGTVTSPLVPWCACAVAMSTYLGVSTLEYIPYCLFNIASPIVSIIVGFSGWTIYKNGEEKTRKKAK